MTDERLRAIKLLAGALLAIPNDLENPAPIPARVAHVLDVIANLIASYDLSPFDRQVLERSRSDRALVYMVDTIDRVTSIMAAAICRVAGVPIEVLATAISRAVGMPVEVLEIATGLAVGGRLVDAPQTEHGTDPQCSPVRECFSSQACPHGEVMSLRKAVEERLTGLIVGQVDDTVSLIQLVNGEVCTRVDLAPDHADSIADALKYTAGQIRSSEKAHGSIS